VDLVCAYRPNGCIVGLVTNFDYIATVLGRDGQDREEIELQRNVACFGHLTAPQAGQINTRDVIVAKANTVPDQVANDALELINTVGGTQTGFDVADMLREYSDFSPDMPVLNVQAQRPEPPPVDLPVDRGGQQLCPVCGENNCGWLAQAVRERR